MEFHQRMHQYSIRELMTPLISFVLWVFMTTTDIEKAFRIMPVHPVDYELLGMKINNVFYYDHALPMGRSI